MAAQGVAQPLRSCVGTMMRITEISRTESVARFRLEGRLTQLTAAELWAAVAPPLAGGASVLLDLAGVSFADTAGVDTLVALRGKGVILAGRSGFLAELLHPQLAPPCAASGGHGGSDDADVRLLGRLRSGDEAAFAELVERNAGRLLAVAQRLLRSDDDARDVVQDAFLSAFRSLATFNGEAKLSTWLHRITVNAALMRLRSRRHRAERSIDDLLPRFDEAGAWAQESGQIAASSQDLLERRETRQLVRRCIDRLPESARTVLLMRDIEDLDTDTAAQLLGITPNAVKIRLHRARQALRTLIEQTLVRGEVDAPRARGVGQRTAQRAAH
jgi:RNA polymerase sigma-70 factor (ECF subfamily)